MKLSATLNRYLALIYARNLIMALSALLFTVYLFDTVELLRRAANKDDVSLALILEMGMLKLPDTGQIIFPFAVLFAAMFTFWQLTKRHELVVARAAGFSVWQFLAPVMGVAVAAGIFLTVAINPLGALFVSRFEQLETDYLGAKKSQVTLLREGLWLRQMQEGSGPVILHAEKVSLPAWELKDVMVLFFNEADGLERRIDAKAARLDQEQKTWVFSQVKSHGPTRRDQAPALAEDIPLVVLPTELTVAEIEESFSSPETISFWNLPGFIRTLEETGFDSARLKIHFQTLLAQPFLFAAMILLAAAVSLRPPRQRGAFLMAALGVMVGFVVFFAGSFLQALGASHQIPVFWAAWSPAMVGILLGTAVILSLEDG